MRNVLRWPLLAFAVCLPLTLSTTHAGASPAASPSSIRAALSTDEQPAIPVNYRGYRSYSDDEDDDDEDDALDDLPPPRQPYGNGYFDKPMIPPAPVYGSYRYAPPPPPVYYQPPAVEWLPPPRPSSCGQYRYWDGERCADARWHPPYTGPRW